MASTVELVWQWAYLVAILLIVLILLCCFGGCWASFSSNVRGFCADGINCGFAPFRKKRKKVAVVKTDGPVPPQGEVMVRTADGRTIVAAEREEVDPWGTLCGGVLSVITCCYCCGVLKPEGEDEEEGEEMLPKNVVAQPVTIVSPVPAKKPQAPTPPVVKAEPVVRIAPAPAPPSRPPPPPEELPPPQPLPEFRAPPREIGQVQGATGAHLPLLHFYTLP